MSKVDKNPFCLLITALGGEGGGVLMNWVVAAARNAGLLVQATSVPGVAQRTGSTSYYIEIGGDENNHEHHPMNLVPMPGRVDVVLASELVEGARALEAGFVSPNRTTLIASTSRTYATSEKIEMGDGRFSSENIVSAAREMAKSCHLLDLAKIAQDSGAFISATMFGALVGSDVLPWGKDVSLAVIAGGGGAKANLAGFTAAFDLVSGDRQQPHPAAMPVAPPLALPAFPPSLSPDGLSDDLRNMIAYGYDRCCEFQDQKYGAQFADRMGKLLTAGDPDDPQVNHALTEISRRLALWMAYEDIARVADLKTRKDRFLRIRAESEMTDGQILTVTDYLKPRMEEVAAVLPVAFGQWLLRYEKKGRWVPFMGKGIFVRSNGFFGYYMLRMMAAFRRIRRSSLRYHEEQVEIEAWLACLQTALGKSPGFAQALAELPRVRKGYSDTQARGLKAYRTIVAQIVEPAVQSGKFEGATQRLRRAMAAALADEKHTVLDDLFKLPADA